MGSVNADLESSQPTTAGNKSRLIKILTVIFLIGILATTGIILFTGFQQKKQASQRDSQRKSDLDNIKKALISFRNATPGSIYYPSCPENVDTSCTLSTDINFNTAPRPITPTYINSIPQDPLNTGDHAYIYDPGDSCLTGVGSICTEFKLYVELENVKDPSAVISQTSCAVTEPVEGRYMLCND